MGLVAPSLLSHGRSGKGAAAGGALMGGGRPRFPEGPRPISVLKAQVTQRLPPVPASTPGQGLPVSFTRARTLPEYRGSTLDWS